MLVFIQGFLKKYEVFEIDFEVYWERVQDIEDVGNKFIEKVNFNEFRIIYFFCFCILFFLFLLKILKCNLIVSFFFYRVIINLS